MTFFTKIFVAFTLLIACLTAHCQERLFKERMFKSLKIDPTITQSNGDSTFTFHIKKPDPDLQPDLKKYYTWFHDGDVKTTRGAYTGKVLHGVYEKFNHQGSLLGKGEFNHGLKTGVWLSWYDNGEMRTQLVYRQGVRSGPFREFYVTGETAKKGKYRNDKLVGKIIHYNEDGTTLKTERFDNGKLIVPKVKKIKVKKNKTTHPATDSLRQKKDRKSLKRSDLKKKKTSEEGNSKNLKKPTQIKVKAQNKSDSKTEKKKRPGKLKKHDTSQPKAYHDPDDPTRL